MNTKPLVTIVTVTYNLIKADRKATFLQAVESVKSQTYPHIQHLIIDGASSDGTKELIEKLGLDYISEPDNGIYDAMNKGIKNAKGKYLALLNSDDFYNDTRMIEKCVQALEEGNLDFVCSNMYHLDEEKPENNYTLYADFSNIFKLMPFGHPTLFCKTEILRKYPFDLQYKIAADYDFVFKLFLNAYKGATLPYTFTTFRIGGACSHDTANEAKSIRKRYLPYKEKIFSHMPTSRRSNKAKISILTIYSDSLSTKLESCKKSVQKQSYTAIEHICIKQEESFICALQEALLKSSGDYIYILAPSAKFSSTSIIEEIMQVFATSKVQAIYSDISTQEHEDKAIFTWQKLLKRQEFLEETIPHQAFIYRHDLLKHIDFTEKYFSDYLFHIELFLKQGFAYAYQNKEIAILDKSDISSPSQEEIERAKTKNYPFLEKDSPYGKTTWKTRVKLFKKLTLVRIVETMRQKTYYLFGTFPIYSKKK